MNQIEKTNKFVKQINIGKLLKKTAFFRYLFNDKLKNIVLIYD